METKDTFQIRANIVGCKITGVTDNDGRITVWINGNKGRILELIVSEPLLTD
jgi:hypothetical protein